jgi:hypothetical protein
MEAAGQTHGRSNQKPLAAMMKMAQWTGAVT